MSDDADLIRKMMVAWYSDYGEEVPVEDAIKKYSQDMARVLAVVREHDAGPERRVPVQIATDTDFDTILALSNDHRIFVARWSGEGFVWTGALPPLPQPGDEA